MFGRELVGELAAFVHRPWLVVTMADLWPRFESQLSEHLAGVHLVSTLELEELEQAADALPACAAIIGLGGGQALDVAKFFAWRTGLPLFQVPTATTVNAPFGHRSGVRDRGRVRYLGWAVPEAVYIDFDVIGSAPPMLNRSGVGDVLCYHTARRDWEIADRLGRTEPKWPFDPGLVADAATVMGSVVDALDDIHDGTEAGIRALVLAHRWGGTTFHDSGWVPRHIEGVDHFVFYNLERITGRHFIHGQPVGLGIVAGSVLQDNEPERMAAALARVGVDIRPEAMGVTWDDVGEALTTLPAFVRDAGLWFSVADTMTIGDEHVARVREIVDAAYGPWAGAGPGDGRGGDPVKIGLSLPQGCDREYLGMDAATAWTRTVEAARWGEDIGFESLWINDHMQVDPPPEEAPIFEPFVEIAALAVETRRARLGHLVLAAAYRNAGLTAKAISTVDVISGGRAILGIGAGWKEDEWLAYGYGFPPARERLAILADYLEIISRMLGPGRATWDGAHAHVRDAIHEPKGLQQPRIPILIGGNGPNVTWRLAARFADELNLDALPPSKVDAALPVIRDRCREIDRDPASLAVSVFIWGEAGDVRAGAERRQRFRDYAALGLDRIIVQGFALAGDPHAIDDIVEDATAVGLL